MRSVSTDYVAAATTLVLGALLAKQFLSYCAASKQLRQLQDAFAREQEKRAADRAGRIKAEQQLKQLHLELALAKSNINSSNETLQEASSDQQAAADGSAEGGEPVTAGTASSSSSKQRTLPVFPLTAIGMLKSCFTNRTGTPRQPHLVPAARAVLKLGPGVPPSCLDGLESFSHCWVLYVFHENTDLAKLMAARAGSSSSSSQHGGGAAAAAASGVKSHIRVPRLNGGKMGVLATRSPHRPVPIGLSTAEVLEVDAAAGVLVLGGADIVDGSPVLDIKPYIPFCDALLHARAPSWVRVEADEEPLALGDVVINDDAAAALTAAWQRVRRRSLYHSAEQFQELVAQVLARDIRSLHQRTNVLPVQAVTKQQQQQQQLQQQQQHALQEEAGTSSSSSSSTERQSSQRPGRYVVALDRVLVSYDICSQTGQIHVRGAETI